MPKIGKNAQKEQVKFDKKIAVYKSYIRETQSFIYHQFNKYNIVGVENLTSKSSKIDLITYSDSYYIHKQIEKRDNMLFMWIKKRPLEQSLT